MKESTVSELYARNLRQLEDYILKHCSLETSKMLRINEKGPCVVIGKRVSISQDLNRKARGACELCRG